MGLKSFSTIWKRTVINVLKESGSPTLASMPSIEHMCTWPRGSAVATARKKAMHQGPLPADRDPCPRTSATTGTRADDRSGFRGSATPTPESRSTVCGVEEPDRTAQGALAENEACSRTVLSRGYSAELETTGSLSKIQISRIGHGSDLR